MLPECPIRTCCSSVSFLLVKDGYDYYRCADCDHVFVYPAPSEDELSRLYSFEAGYHNSSSEEAEGATLPPRLKSALDDIERAAPIGTILDVGCTTGSFLNLAESRGWIATGVELNADTARISRGLGLDVITGTIESIDPTTRQFDVIHMGEVIEHVENPAAMVRPAANLLKPGGVLYVTTPNTDAFWPKSTFILYRLFGIPWSQHTPPWHLQHFSVQSLSRLLSDHGFSGPQFSFDEPGLDYELGQTGVRRAFKAAVREKGLHALSVTGSDWAWPRSATPRCSTRTSLKAPARRTLECAALSKGHLQANDRRRLCRH